MLLNELVVLEMLSSSYQLSKVKIGTLFQIEKFVLFLALIVHSF